MYTGTGRAAALEKTGAGGEELGGERKQTPYGPEELVFLAHLKDADPEH